MRIANEHVGDVLGERLVDVPIQQLLQNRLIVLQFINHQSSLFIIRHSSLRNAFSSPHLQRNVVVPLAAGIDVTVGGVISALLDSPLGVLQWLESPLLWSAVIHALQFTHQFHIVLIVSE